MGDVPSLENVILLASVNVLCSSGANSRMTHPWKWGIFPCASDGMTRLRLRKSPFAGLVILLPTLLENRPSSRVVSASRERGPLSQQLKGRACLLISLKKGLPKMRKKALSRTLGETSATWRHHLRSLLGCFLFMEKRGTQAEGEHLTLWYMADDRSVSVKLP
jgi:hypothetical protein